MNLIKMETVCPTGTSSTSMELVLLVRIQIVMEFLTIRRLRFMEAIH